MNGFDVYKIYLGIKSHFKNESYDYIRYGNPKAKPQTFYTRNDRYFFERISKKYKDDEIVNLFVANFITNENLWIGDFLTTELESAYIDWCRRQESIEYIFEQDVSRVCDILENKNLKFDNLFDCNDGHPIIFRLLMQKEISPETYVIIDQILSFNKDFDIKLSKDAAYHLMSLKYKKYKPFVKIKDQSLYRKKLLNMINRYALA